MRLIVKWLITAAALYVAAALVSGIDVADQQSLLIAALVIGLVNALLKPLIVLLTLPITFVTLGLFYLVVNAGMLAIAARLTPGFELGGFWSAFFGAIVISLVSMALGSLLPDRRRREAE
jgi:putative membrane protein